MQDPGPERDHDHGGNDIHYHRSAEYVDQCTLNDCRGVYVDHDHDNDRSDVIDEHHATRSDIDKRRFLDLNTAADIIDATKLEHHITANIDGWSKYDDGSANNDEPEYVLVRRDDLDNLAHNINPPDCPALIECSRTLINNHRRADDGPKYAAVLNDTAADTDDGTLWRLLVDIGDPLDRRRTFQQRALLRHAVAARYGS